MGERYVSETTGQSTEHAEKVADAYKAKDLLKEVLGSRLPDRTKFNLGNNKQPYVVKETDTGLLQILQDQFPGVPELRDKNYLRLAYGHMFSKVDKHWKEKEKTNPNEVAKNPKTQKPKVYTVNFIQPNDRLWVENGTLHIEHSNSNYYANFQVDLFPWPKVDPTPQRSAIKQGL